MDKPKIYCEECGAQLSRDALFCEQCGAPVAATHLPVTNNPPFERPAADPLPGWETPPEQAQTLKASFGPPVAVKDALEVALGHVPVDFEEIGRRGRPSYRDGELLITSRRLLYLHNAFWSDDERWFIIQQDWAESFGGDIDDVPTAKLRAIGEAYEFAGPDWADLYDAPPDDLLADNKRNFAVPLEMVVSADITLDDSERDQLDLLLSDGRKLHFMLYLALGGPCARFMQQALGAARVHVARVG